MTSFCIEDQKTVFYKGKEGGQATLELACLLPLFFTLLLILIQPLLYAYTLMVMNNAAAEGCRLLATQTVSYSGSYAHEQAEEYVQRRLASIPPVPLFHIHEPCSYVITLTGSEETEFVSVSIENKMKALPVVSWGMGVMGLADKEGCITQYVQVETRSQPAWSVGSLNKESLL